MARRLARWTMWVVKAALAAVALAALVAWPWTHRYPGRIDGIRWTLTPDRADCVWLDLAWGDGRVGVGRGQAGYAGSSLNRALMEASGDGPGWTWRGHTGAQHWKPFEGDAFWGPLRRASIDDAHDDGGDERTRWSFIS